MTRLAKEEPLKNMLLTCTKMGFGPPGGWGWVGWGLMMGKWTKHEVETAEMTLHFYRGRYYIFLVILGADYVF